MLHHEQKRQVCIDNFMCNSMRKRNSKSDFSTGINSDDNSTYVMFLTIATIFIFNLKIATDSTIKGSCERRCFDVAANKSSRLSTVSRHQLCGNAV